jgi:F420H(2)-dependent quinone reductase
VPAPNEIRAFNRSVIEEFRSSNGQVPREILQNVPLVLLTTTGARTGMVERHEGNATTAEGAERDRLYGILKASRPEAAAHQDRTERLIPLVVIDYGH